MFDLLAALSLHPKRTAAVLVVLLAFGVWRRRARAGRIASRVALVTALGLGTFLLSALTFVGPPRRALLAGIKRQQAEQGRLVQTARWGVVDLQHVDATRAHIEQARRHLHDPLTRGEPLTLVSEGGTLSGAAWSTTHVYRLIEPERFDEMQIDAAARAVALQAAFDLEVEQERAPWSSGLALTAWQYEDLPSALFAVGADPNEPTMGLFEPSGAVFTGELVRSLSVQKELTPDERAQIARIRAARELWTAAFSAPLRWSELPEGQAS